MSVDDGSNAVSRNILISASVSLAVMIVDFVWLLREERKRIWPKVRSSQYAKLYVLSRYPGLVGQIFNVYFVSRMDAGTIVAPSTCKMWYSYQATMVQLLLAAVEGPLMHRVYALYFRNRAILLLLILIAAAQIGSMIVSARMSVPGVRYTGTCLVIKTHPGSVYFSATTMATNVVIFFMTFWKYFSLPRRWTQGAFGRVVLRDSALSLIATSLLLLFMMLCTLNVIKTSMSGNITYYWLVCTLWVTVGRIIINHERVSLEDENYITSEIEMVSVSTMNAATTTLHSTKATSTIMDSSMTTGTVPDRLPAQSQDNTCEESPTCTIVNGAHGMAESPTRSIDQESDSVSSVDHRAPIPTTTQK
ncbi:hypothetical protein F5I97DRAFT_1840716 [Phlebopus sp. FC_14]|nr:hypothetical protein F5I97DRAFT_1840716 [Phlebopus sp. FC_14]